MTKASGLQHAAWVCAVAIAVGACAAPRGEEPTDAAAPAPFADADRCCEAGKALADAGESEAAVRAYRDALRIDADHAWAHHLLGHSLATLGRLDEAIDAFRRARDLEPQKPEPWIDLAYALRDSGDIRGARAELERRTQLFPEDADAWNELAWFLVEPEADSRQWDPREGLRAARRSVALSSAAVPQYLDTLAEALFLTGDPASALLVEEKALELLASDREPDAAMQAAFELSLIRYRAAAEREKKHP